MKLDAPKLVTIRWDLKIPRRKKKLTPAVELEEFMMTQEVRSAVAQWEYSENGLRKK